MGGRLAAAAAWPAGWPASTASLHPAFTHNAACILRLLGLQGDSGSPLISKGPSGDVAVGVTTRAVGCLQGSPTVYADAAAASNWISNAIQVKKRDYWVNGARSAADANMAADQIASDSAKPRTLLFPLGLLMHRPLLRPLEQWHNSGSWPPSNLCLCCLCLCAVDAA